MYTPLMLTRVARRGPEVLLLFYDRLLHCLEDVLINSHNPMLLNIALCHLL